MFQPSSFPSPSFSFPASQGDVGKLKERHFPLELNPDIASPKDFSLLGMGERKIIKTSTEFHILDFLTLAWTVIDPPGATQPAGKEI